MKLLLNMTVYSGQQFHRAGACSWNIMEHRDPSKTLKVIARSRSKDAPCMLLRPCHLIRRLLPFDDPLLEFQKAKQAAASAAWLPNPEVELHQIPRGVLLLGRVDAVEGHGDWRPPSLLPLEEVCDRCPWMPLITEEPELEATLAPADGEACGHTEPSDDSRELVDFDMCLEKGDDLLGISVEAHDSGLRVASISERGLVGQRNRAEVAERLAEGSVILEINGVKDDADAMRQQLEEPILHLRVRPARGACDVFGRRMGAQPAVFPHAEIKGEIPLCRCTGRCRCGLADALGRARDERSWAAPQPALAIANLHREVTEEMLYSFFTKVAPVATVRVVRDTKTLQSEQHGYVNFYTFQDAEKVLKTLDGSVLYRQRCLLSWSTRAKQPPEPLLSAPPPAPAPTAVRVITSCKPVSSMKEHVAPAEQVKSDRPRRKAI
ncbi:unnamed protein product [Durusdinium trenchii]|uniref:RRM domain-containing protein n=1 Tax=Durusdinium trenchii TaxID=1381693 RepID=A0ABP0MTX5_9DINO